jgi:hypothetical protein
MVSSMTPVAVARAAFSCSLCPHAAGAVELVEGDAPGATLEFFVTGFGSSQAIPVEAAVGSAAVAALAAGEARRLFALAPLATPFYCPDCDRVFCSHHWVSLPLLDDHVLAGTYATCPEGHTRLIDGMEDDGP